MRSGRGASSARRRALRASAAVLTTWNLPSAASTALRTSSASSTARIVDLGALTPRTVAEAPEARLEPLHGEPLAQLAPDDERKDQQSADAGDQQRPVGGAAPGQGVPAATRARWPPPPGGTRPRRGAGSQTLITRSGSTPSTVPSR